MKYNKLLLVILFVLCNFLLAQNSITYNPETGNYDIVVNNEDTTYTAVYEPATKVDPTINSSCTSPNNDVFKYEYSVTNGESSRQRLLKILIEYFSNINDKTEPNNEWSMGKYRHIPVFSWAHTRADPTGVWVPTTGIEQGTTVSGFSFESRGLPSIVNSYFKGLVSTGIKTEPPPDIDAFLDSIRVFPTNSVLKKTVGPKDPPEKFRPIAFTDTLIAYTNQSKELGWFTDQSIANKYTNHFQSVKNYIQQNNIQESINILNTVLQEVQQDSGVTVTSEAYALIYFNSKYLSQRLEEE